MSTQLSGEQYFRGEQIVPRPLSEVFAFFCDEKNLETLTPPWLNFRVIAKTTPTIQKGTLIDYRLRIHGVPIKWRSEILEWEPGKKFVDQQVKGPYAKWHHTHLFRDLGERTEMIDEVRYAVPFGFLGQIFAGGFVKRDVENIFAYRRKKVEEIFGRG